MKLNREKIIPHLKQKTITPIYRTEGNVYSIKKFTSKHKILLSTYEQGFIDRNTNSLNDKIPKHLTQPLSVIESNSAKPIVSVTSIGSRSAFWSEKKLKFKGCKPIANLYFPHEQLNFGQTRMTTTKIIFGALSAENIMREILAYCFFKENKLLTFQKPMVVFEYINNGIIIGYCLVFKSPSEIRLESREDFRGLTIKELIVSSIIQRKNSKKISESGFKNISKKWYTNNKSQLLAKMNFAGGFRGILNSNLGNDIEFNKRFYICDFDTFKVIKIPKKASSKFINNFVLWCLTELLKTSPLVLDYIDISNQSKYNATLKLWNSYSNNSTLWLDYKHEIDKLFEQNVWDKKYLETSINRVLKTDVIHNLILDNVINSKILKKSYKPEQSFYIPHNN